MVELAFSVLVALIVVLFLAFAFDFMNGFHDAANAIATVVGTRVLSPLKAVALAAFGNFIAFLVYPLAVAATLAKGIVDQQQLLGLDLGVAMLAVAAGLLGALLWDIITWYLALPTSSSHALVGGMLGGALAAIGPAAIIPPDPVLVQRFLTLAGGGGLVGAALGAAIVLLLRSPRPLRGILVSAAAGVVATVAVISLLGALKALHYDLGPLVPLAAKPSGIFAVMVFMIASPLLGIGIGYLFVSGIMRACRHMRPTRVNAGFGRLQLVSAAFFAIAHGGNDAQKTMGVVVLLLVVTQVSPAGADVPLWVVLGAHSAIALGTLLGGWRIVRTMAKRITHLRPYQGFAAETAGGGVLTGMALAGIPVSTTHAIASSIMGVGLARGRLGVRWHLARSIVWAWLLTIPASLGMAMGIFSVGRLFIG